MIKKTLKKLGLPILVLSGFMMFVSVPRADAKHHHIHTYAYPYAYDPYYYPYGYGYDYPYYGGGFFGGFGGGHHDRVDRGRVGRGFGGGRGCGATFVGDGTAASGTSAGFACVRGRQRIRGTGAGGWKLERIHEQSARIASCELRSLGEPRAAVPT